MTMLSRWGPLLLEPFTPPLHTGSGTAHLKDPAGEQLRTCL